MDANFKKFKRKVWIEILIKCISCGLAAAFWAVDAVFLPCKLFGIDLLWLFYILIGVGGFILGALIAFLIFRTNDKKIAMRLDRELGLKERVQTAYEYSGQTSDIHDLQRLNTSAVLGAVSVESLKFANVASLILSGVIAAVGIAAVPVTANNNIVPWGIFASKSETPPEEPKREVTDWEWAALDELINYVKSSKKADAVVKTGMLLELENLRGVLVNGVSQSGLSNFVQGTVTNIRNIVIDANERSGVTDEQKDLNTSEANYVINKLYEIFNLSKSEPNEGEENKGPGNSKDPNEGEENEGPGNNNWEIGGNDVPFFDPESGYTTSSNSAIRNSYYELVQRAFEEGVLSREEWEYIMATYFADLSKDE
ncbi:MAG: hypothetical protein J1G07_03710 [Clostridiales bacterium]|nr:hypothetical protein [Clostridiales bacterium]